MATLIARVAVEINIYVLRSTIPLLQSIAFTSPLFVYLIINFTFEVLVLWFKKRAHPLYPEGFAYRIWHLTLWEP